MREFEMIQESKALEKVEVREFPDIVLVVRQLPAFYSLSNANGSGQISLGQDVPERYV